MSVPKFSVKWSGNEYPIEDFPTGSTVADLKTHLQEKTGVLVHRQKVLGLKTKISGGAVSDDTKLEDLVIKENQKFMMMGSSEEAITKAAERPENLPEVVDDAEDVELSDDISQVPEYLDKIKKRIETLTIKELNPLREGKKLLVLDIDYTLFDHKSTAESAAELKRPFLHEFLSAAYEHYDIVIWSATSMKWIEVKMNQLGVSSHTGYKVAFYLDSSYMISVWIAGRGLINCKPLGVIWGKYPQFSAKNTIMFDDVSRNFLMNPQSGLKIRAFREAHFNRDKDRELLKLSKYLRNISGLSDFTPLNHDKWKRYHG